MDQPTSNRITQDVTKFFKILEEMRSTSQLCDVILVAENVEIEAHRAVLAACSPYFRAMFANFVESKQERIVLQEMNSNTLRTLVNYMYHTEIMVFEDEVQDILQAANYLQLADLRDACAIFLKNNLNPTNCLGISEYAKRHACERLESDANDYVVKHFTHVVKSEEFLSLPKEKVVNLISNNDINTRSEEEVFECVIKWVNHKSERKGSIADIMEYVKLPLLSHRYLSQKVNFEPLVYDNIICLKYLTEAFSYNSLDAQQKARVNIHRTTPRGQKARVDIHRTTPRVPKEKVIVVIGEGHYGKIKLEWLDLKKRRWFPLTELPEASSVYEVVAIEGIMYVLDYGTQYHEYRRLQKFDSATKVWSNCANMNFHGGGFAATSLNNRIYAVGGQNLISGHSISVEVEKYCPRSDKWTNLTSMLTTRHDAGAVGLNGLLYMVGGRNRDNFYLKSCEVYSPELNSWRSIADMNIARCFLGAVGLNGLLYVVGGRNIHGNYLKSCEVYRPELNSWRSIADMNIARRRLGLVAKDNLIYAIGGYGINDVELNSIEVYNPQSDTWTLLSSNLNTVRGKCFGVLIDNPGNLN